MYRHYDEAVKEFLKVKLKGSPVPIVGPVNPSRAFARVRDIHKDDPRVISDDKYTPLPFISFMRMDALFAQERFHRANLRKIKYNENANSVLGARRPMPYDLPYQVDIWAEYEDDLILLTESYLRRWRGPMKFLDVWHGEPYGDYKIGMPTPEVRDLSELESDDQNRMLRMALSFTLQGCLSFPAEEVPTVREILTQVAIANNPNTVADDYVETIDRDSA